MSALRPLVLVLAFAGCGGDCPSSQPSGGCGTSESCHYGKTRCDCYMNSGFEPGWSCVDDACPATDTPTGTCSQEGLQCRYHFEWTCSCEGGGWTCIGGQPLQHDLARPVEDLSVPAYDL
jgi:hypothetical protein